MNQLVRISAIAAAVVLLGVACGDDDPVEPQDPNQQQDSPNSDEPDNSDEPEEPPCEVVFFDSDGDAFETLGEYCFFDGDLADTEPAAGVIPYEVTAELYSDLSHKERFIALPPGESIGFDDTEPWDWPDNAILIKTFYYPLDERDPEAGRRILETRLLYKQDGQWSADSYVWDEEQQEAHRHNFGQRVDVEFIDDGGNEVEIDYRIPNRNQCMTCHGQDGDLEPLGPRTRQLLQPHGDSPDGPIQLEFLDESGLFDTAIPDPSELFGVVDPHDEQASLDDRARSYLDANCAHCHNPEGRASTSNLHLQIDETNERRIGICKSPVAAGQAAGGRPYDIVPGEPDESIMIYRMESTEPSHKMPELPITTIDEFGVGLIRQWISEMEPPGCP